MRCVVASGFHRACVNSFACHAIDDHQVVATRRRVEVPQEPVGPVAERQRPRSPRDPAFDRPDVADGVPSLPGELRERGLLRGERSQQIGLARLDLREQCPAALRRLLECGLLRRHARRLHRELGAERRVRALHAVEHHGAVHQVGERVRLQQVRGRRSRTERHERLSRALVQPGLDGLRVRARSREIVLRLHQPPLQAVERAAGGAHVRRQGQDPALELGDGRAGRPRPVAPAGPRVRAPSRPASGRPRRTRRRPTWPTRATPPRRGGAKRSVWPSVLPPRSSIGRPGETLDVAEGTLGYGPMMAPDPLDFLDVDHLLSEEERQVRDLVREWVGEKVLPDIDGWFEAGTFPKEIALQLGTLGLLGHAPRGLRMSGRERRQLRTRVPGARGGRLGLPFVRERPGFALHVPDLEVRHRGAEAALAPEDGDRRGDRLLRADRGRLRQRSRTTCARRPSATATTGC